MSCLRLQFVTCDQQLCGSTTGINVIGESTLGAGCDIESESRGYVLVEWTHKFELFSSDVLCSNVDLELVS